MRKRTEKENQSILPHHLISVLVYWSLPLASPSFTSIIGRGIEGNGREGHTCSFLYPLHSLLYPASFINSDYLQEIEWLALPHHEEDNEIESWEVKESSLFTIISLFPLSLTYIFPYLYLMVYLFLTNLLSFTFGRYFSISKSIYHLQL